MKCHAMTKARRTISGILTKTFNVDLIIRKQPDKTAEHLALQLAWILQKCQRVKQPPPPSKEAAPTLPPHLPANSATQIRAQNDMSLVARRHFRRSQEIWIFK